ASPSERASLSTPSDARALRTATDNSQYLATHTVQVTSDAKTKPIITNFTMMSAFMNMPHGDRSRGSSSGETEALPTAGAGGAAGALVDGATGTGAAAGGSVWVDDGGIG